MKAIHNTENLQITEKTEEENYNFLIPPSYSKIITTFNILEYVFSLYLFYVYKYIPMS